MDTPTTSPLKDLLKKRIDADGPMTLGAYMTLCLHHSEHGYYATRPGLGRDFTTAPEISQIFGDLIGIWAVSGWALMSSPARLNLVEIGAGRATLMSDTLRATQSFADFHDALNLTLIEPSPALRKVQTDRLGIYKPNFIQTLDELPDGPCLLIGNEVLDCLPARQYVRRGEDWHERVIGLDDQGELTLGTSAEPLPSPPLGADRATGHLFEFQPGLEEIVDMVATRAQAGQPTAALFIDYGPAETPPQDTLRAYWQSQQIDPLAAPGLCDLTVDADFGRLKALAEAAGLHVSGPKEQGAFLLALGAEAHLNRLAQTASDGGQSLYEGVKRLVDPDEMGSRFKVICLSDSASFKPAGF